MTLNLYVMPIIGAGVKGDGRRPKYKDTVFSTLDWSMFDYGNEPWCLVGIVDVPAATDTTLQGEPDVLALPVNLDQALGTNQTRNRVSNALETANIPGTWVTTTNTWRDVVEFVGALCQFAGRYQGIVDNVNNFWFTTGVTLASTFGNLPVAKQQAFTQTVQFFGFDTSGLVSTATLRAILRSIGQQYLATQPPLDMADVTV